jgi:hypothetical protein
MPHSLANADALLPALATTVVTGLSAASVEIEESCVVIVVVAPPDADVVVALSDVVVTIVVVMATVSGADSAPPLAIRSFFAAHAVARNARTMTVPKTKAVRLVRRFTGTLASLSRC